ncbi:MAG: hypothetical protein JWL96_666 [Sphingomonas bacterium]|uniref:hypothetical protein n=1 Tax=Sphingomonas bacterium TaxID=1895847 RepID=UPI00260D546E|nr:hypothetical protein [Sphingomonas bacterium]MDB5708596.1 hypothetical protein [Sphingomonas bacterium]
MFEPPLAEDGMFESLGLIGDGDEISAIRDVERCFGVTLDHSEASGWRTVGNVYSALEAALPADRRTAPDNWTRFTQAISDETGIDPTNIGRDTLLLATGGRRRWHIILAIVVIGAVAAAILR